MVLGVVVIIAALNVWSIYATLWHWRHGDRIQCGNRTIPVPRDWFQVKSDRACNITAMEPEFHRPKGFAVARFYSRTDTPSSNDEQWRTDYTGMMIKNGYSIGRISDVTVAGIPTVCVESNKPSDPDDLHIVCAVSKQMMIMFRYTDKKWEAGFYNILRGMQ